MSDKNFYITTTLPYVNAEPHIGFALELIQADIQARFHTLIGDNVFFNTGTDEHGVKIQRKAIEKGMDTQAFVDEASKSFIFLSTALNIYQPHFIRTTEPKHIKAAQEFWIQCTNKNDIYLKNYQIKYCVGCELEKTDSELINGQCILHPHNKIEFIDEENYFFRFSNYKDALLAMYDAQPEFVLPLRRFNEIKKFVENGLQDFSISRRKDKMPWGIPVPNDDQQVMYVWFDALVSYISTLNWPEQTEFTKYWGTRNQPNAVQMAGKDNLRQQSAMWQAMLMSAGLPPSKQIIIHGFITSEGQKMSKSVGNVISPNSLIEEFGTDAVRYFFAGHMSTFEDSDFSMSTFVDIYNAKLANGLGNLTSRIMQLSQTYLPAPVLITDLILQQDYIEAMQVFDTNKVVEIIWKRIDALNVYITDNKPFNKVKENLIDGQAMITYCLEELWYISQLLSPIIPETSKKIIDSIFKNQKTDSIFPRKE